MKKSIGYLLVGGLCLFQGIASAAVTVYTDEAAYLNALAALGYSTLQESFENDAVWGGTRSPLTAASVTSQGITWTTNFPLTNEITTGPGAARTGLWAIYDPNHGDATGTIAECDVVNPPLDCFAHDGFSGSMPAPDTIYAVGGFITGIVGADVDIIIDGVAHHGGSLSAPGYIFTGVIDTDGFNTFEFRELEGQVEQLLYIFGDDFTIATSASQSGNNAPVLAAIGDQTTEENVPLNVSLSASDADGDNLSYSMNGEPIGAIFTDNSDGTADFSWTPTTGTAGDYPVTFTVTDDGVPAASDTESIIITVTDSLVDATPPVITLLGDNPMSVEVGSSYIEPGATAVDNLDGDISGSIVVAGVVDTAVIGTYSVTYNVSDAAGNPATEVTRIVNVYSSAAGTLQFSAISYSVSEDGVSATITVTRLSGSSGAVGVDYTSSDASATAGNDYTAVSGNLSFADGVISQSFSVPVLDDAVYEGDETLNLSLSNPTGGASLGTPLSSIVTITENDPALTSGSLQFSSSAYVLAENATTATITVTRDGGSTGVVGVDFASSDTSASAGSDYTAVSGSLSFADGVSSQSFSIPVLDDTIYEGDEMVNLSLSNPTGGAILGTPSTAVLTIVENDSQTDGGSSGGGSFNLMTLIALLGLYLRNFLMNNLISVTSLNRYQAIKS